MKKFVKEIYSYIIIIVIVVLVRSFIITPVIVNGPSMEKTLYNGELLILNKLDKELNKLKRYDIVVINDKNDNELIMLDEKIKLDDNNKINIDSKKKNDNNDKKKESEEKMSDKKDDMLFNPINIDDDEKDGVDDFENLEEFII